MGPALERDRERESGSVGVVLVMKFVEVRCGSVTPRKTE